MKWSNVDKPTYPVVYFGVTCLSIILCSAASVSHSMLWGFRQVFSTFSLTWCYWLMKYNMVYIAARIHNSSWPCQNCWSSSYFHSCLILEKDLHLHNKRLATMQVSGQWPQQSSLQIFVDPSPSSSGIWLSELHMIYSCQHMFSRISQSCSLLMVAYIPWQKY